MKNPLVSVIVPTKNFEKKMNRWLIVLLSFFSLILIISSFAYFIVINSRQANTDSYYKTLSAQYSDIGIITQRQQWTDRNHKNNQELLAKKIIHETYKAQSNNLGIIAIVFNTHDRSINDRILFRIKEASKKNWYYQNIYNANQFQTNIPFPFGFPIITNSNNKSYTFEIESLEGKLNNSLSLSKTNSYFITKYKFSKDELIKNPGKLYNFIIAKIIEQVSFVKVSQIFFIFVFSLIPFAMYKLFAFLTTKNRFADKSKKVVNLSKDRLGYLEGLRGIASLIVVIDHYAFAFYPAAILGTAVASHTKYEAIIYSTPLNLFVSGNFAVLIFFVLSGYVLSYKYFRNFDSRVIQRLAIGRYFRLMIPVLGSVFLGYILLRFHVFFNSKIYLLTYSNWLGTFYNFMPKFIDMLYQGLFGTFINADIPSYNVLLWIMYYEFLGSFLVFSFLSIFGNTRIRSIVYICLSCIFFKTYFFSFLLGMLLCDITVGNKLRIVFSKKFTKLWYLSLIVALLIGSYPQGTQGTIYAFFQLSFFSPFENMIIWHTIAAFLLLASILNLESLKNFLSKKYLLFLGKISFSVYLIHILVLFSFSSLLFYTVRPYMSYDMAFVFVFLISLIFIICSAYLYAKYIDSIGIKFSRFIANKVLGEKN